jgi:autotransporter passenger strand-loop-strand repeat protein
VIVSGGEMLIIGPARPALVTVVGRTEIVLSGGTTNDTTVSGGGELELFGGASADLTALAGLFRYRLATH